MMRKRCSLMRGAFCFASPCFLFMETPISDSLHRAAVAALDGKDYSLVASLIELLSRGTAMPTTQAASAAMPNATSQDRVQLALVDDANRQSHSRTFWQGIIASKWIPLRIDLGELVFTSVDLMKWIDTLDVELTPKDLAKDSKSLFYRRMISNALGELKSLKILSSESNGKVYRINAQAFMAYRPNFSVGDLVRVRLDN
jgi:hypothetical protein